MNLEIHQFGAAEATDGTSVIFCRGCGEVRPLELPAKDEPTEESAGETPDPHATHRCGMCEEFGDQCGDSCEAP